jgi:hypothetical protein
MGQLPSRNDTDIGSRTTLQYSRVDQPVVQVLILLQIGWELSAEVEYQNRLISSKAAIVKESDMREVRDFGSGIKGMLQGLKADMAKASDAFQSEVQNAKVNTEKVVSLAADLKSANQEVEDFLGEAVNSNFPPAGDGSATPAASLAKADINGVSKNSGSK